MQIIKLDATNSTNVYLKGLMLSKNLEDFTVVVAHEQTTGKGQRGTHWQSEPGKNLTFSLLKKDLYLPVADRFMLNVCVSLGIYHALKSLDVPNVQIKWPNDILSGRCKICGILIENILLGNQVQASIIGIGLNINQISFPNLENVSSLKLLLGKTFNLDEVLHTLLLYMEKAFRQLGKRKDEKLKLKYEEALFRKDKPSTFSNENGELFMGFLKGITNEGKLMVILEDNVLKEFDLKEISLLY